MKRGRLDILLIEDDDNDIYFVKRATEQGPAGHTVHAVHDGEEAICYLRGEGPFADRKKFPLPNIILTDLKMPRMNGFEFLSWVRKHPECRIIPVLMYSSSHLDADIREAYRLGANSYITKPRGLDELVDLLHA